jgi:DNA polymerase-3 subunit delta'
MTDLKDMSHSEKLPWLDDHWAFFMQRLSADRLAHALMIEGPAGSGKMALGRAMVARLLCSGDEARACGNCRSCQLLAGGAHPDYFNLQPEEDSKVIKVDQVRGLIAKLNLTTSVSMRKVAFIHPAECMHRSAANALLKSLEEPAGDSVLILVSDQPGRLPATIRSRCQSIVINQPDSQLVQSWLVNMSGKPQAEVAAALQAAGGSPLRAAQYLDSPELDAFNRVREGLALLLNRPGSVSMVSNKLDDLNPADLWRWVSMCTGDVIRSTMTGLPLNWLPEKLNLRDKTLLQLQQQADINRQLSATPVRGDLLLQSWLIRWAEQAF